MAGGMVGKEALPTGGRALSQPLLYNYLSPDIEGERLLLRENRGESDCFLHVFLGEDSAVISALIHAATMVTAGVFMIARCSPLFEYPPTAKELGTQRLPLGSELHMGKERLENDPLWHGLVSYSRSSGREG
ncbi:hypothetical protein L6452_40362 [Arctium lappa]|uniref:Uncharacterized protein n=1 Tax=Arctium lappa TaxID=4217 RepID=A0ACB8XNG9_ARCLA|nr:hypothetical protein L6452_40362 [Arctium lappa]